MKDLYELLDMMRERPGMYLGGNSIYRLESFINGYLFARTEMGLESTMEELDFGEFHDWIQEELKLKTTKSWSSMILFVSYDEKDALKRFFDLFDRFRIRDDSKKTPKPSPQ